MNAPARPVVRDTADIQLDFSTLEGRIQYLKMSKEDLHVIWSVVTAIGHAIKIGDPQHSPMIDRNVTGLRNEARPDGVPVILLSDLNRIFCDDTLIRELQRVFPSIVNDAARVACWKFRNCMYGCD